MRLELYGCPWRGGQIFCIYQYVSLDNPEKVDEISKRIVHLFKFIHKIQPLVFIYELHQSTKDIKETSVHKKDLSRVESEAPRIPRSSYELFTNCDIQL